MSNVSVQGHSFSSLWLTRHVCVVRGLYYKTPLNDCDTRYLILLLIIKVAGAVSLELPGPSRTNKSLNKLLSKLKSEPQVGSFTVSCSCPWYKEPVCKLEHTCSLVTWQHAYNEAPCAYALYFLVHLKEKKPIERWNNG